VPAFAITGANEGCVGVRESEVSVVVRCCGRCRVCVVGESSVLAFAPVLTGGVVREIEISPNRDSTTFTLVRGDGSLTCIARRHTAISLTSRIESTQSEQR